MSKDDDFKISWKIKSVDLISFSQAERTDSEIFDPDKIQFEFGIDMAIDPKLELVTIQLQVRLYPELNSSERIGAIHTKVDFHIGNFSQVLKQYDSPPKFPARFIATLVGVSIATTRGMLVMLSKGTSFEKAILPVINPMSFVTAPTTTDTPETPRQL